MKSSLYMRLFILALLLTVAVAAFADGCAFGKGFTPQLRETHQLAVINLTESTADVSMFIAIEGIPAGQSITYILPFWYKPEGFSLTETDANSFRKTWVAPAHTKVRSMERLSTHRSSKDMSKMALTVSAGLISILIPFHTFGARTKGSQASGITSLTPYSTNETAHARVELYSIGKNDLQQLITQSGLSEKYLKPLEKYRTPYFAVMRLKGLSSAEKEPEKMSGKGIQYHFTHNLTDGQYSYPLGTGAAWPQPIPITEVYLTCPENLAMQINAPIEGEKISWMQFNGRASSLMYYLAESPNEQKKEDDYWFGETKDSFLSPKTSSQISADTKRPFAWHIAYLLSNPDKDISVHLSKRSALWKFRVIDFFALPGVPLITCMILYLLSWLATARLIIRRRWHKSEKPGNLIAHIVGTFFKAQLIVPAVLIIIGIVAFAYNLFINADDYDTAIPFMVLLAVILFAASIFLIMGRFFTHSDETEISGNAFLRWKKSLFKAKLIVPVFALIIYAIAAYSVLQRYPDQTLTSEWSGIFFFVVIAGIMVTAVTLYARKASTYWHKWLTLTSWLFSSAIFIIMVGLLYGFLYWCETI